MTTQAPRKRRRPFGLYAVIVLLLVDHLSFAVSSDDVQIGLTRVLSLPSNVSDSEAVRALSAVLAVVLLIVVVGLWRLQRWAWVATMIFIGVSLTVGIVQYIRDLPLYWTMIINVFIVFYLNQRDVQDAFARRRSRELRA